MRTICFAIACILGACATTPTHTTALAVNPTLGGMLVPDGAISVVLSTAPESVEVIGDDFDNTRDMRALACFNIPDGTRVIRVSARMAVRFSPSPCVSIAASLPSDMWAAAASGD